MTIPKLLCHTLVVTCLFSAGTPALHAAKRVVVDQSSQTLRAYENGQLVMSTRVSTGKPGKRTPNGKYRARMKKRMHYSSRYNNAPMPYSVQFSGHYFLHGYSHVPSYPASSGCVRLPLNAAPAFFNWITPGTPITVTGSWTPPARQQTKTRRTAERKKERPRRGPQFVAERFVRSR